MSYVSKNLMPGERVVHRTRIHWNGYLAPVALATVMLAAGVAFDVLLVMAAIAATLFVPWFLAVHVRRMSTEFAITDRRIIMKVGLLHQSSSEILLRRLESIRVDQTFLDRMLDRGTLVFSGTGGHETVLQHITRPLEFRRQAQICIEALEHSSPGSTSAPRVVAA